MRLKILDLKAVEKFATCSGEPFHIEYSAKMLGNGNFKLVQSGKTDIKAKIAAQVPLTDMAFILSKLAQGDTSVLNPKEPMYGDFTELPKTMAEALNLVLDGQRKFQKLPLSVRDKFGQDFHKWFATAGSSEWLEAMNIDTVSSSAASVASSSRSDIGVADDSFGKVDFIGGKNE